MTKVYDYLLIVRVEILPVQFFSMPQYLICIYEGNTNANSRLIPNMNSV